MRKIINGLVTKDFIPPVQMAPHPSDTNFNNINAIITLIKEICAPMFPTSRVNSIFKMFKKILNGDEKEPLQATPRVHCEMALALLTPYLDPAIHDCTPNDKLELSNVLKKSCPIYCLCFVGNLV